MKFHTTASVTRDVFRALYLPWWRWWLWPSEAREVERMTRAIEAGVAVSRARAHPYPWGSEGADGLRQGRQKLPVEGTR